MKSFIISSLLILLLSGSALAQQGFKLGVLALPQNTWIFNPDDWNAPEDEYNYRVTFGMAAGPQVGYNFSDNFGVRANVLYSLQGQQWTHRNDDLELVNNKLRLHYLKLPVMVGFNTNTEYSKVIFSMYAGFQAGLLLRAQYTNDDQNYVPDQVLWDDVLDYPTTYEQYKWLDYGPVLDVGFDVKLAFNVMANLHLRADYSLGDIEDKDVTVFRMENGVPVRETYWDSQRAASQNINAGITIGITYTFSSY